MLEAFLVLVAVDVTGIALVYWLAANAKWADRCARLGPRLWLLAALAVVLLPLLGMILSFISLENGPDVCWVLAGPFALHGAASSDPIWLALVLLAAIAAFPLRPRWWTALITTLGSCAWLLSGVAAYGVGC